MHLEHHWEDAGQMQRESLSADGLKRLQQAFGPAKVPETCDEDEGTESIAGDWRELTPGRGSPKKMSGYEQARAAKSECFRTPKEAAPAMP